MLNALTVKVSELVNEEGRMVNRIDLKFTTKVWVKFLKSRLMPTTHITIIYQEKLILLYAIVKGFRIDVGKITEKEIRECVMKKQNFLPYY